MTNISLEIAKLDSTEKNYILYHLCKIVSLDNNTLTTQWNNSTTIDDLIMFFKWKHNCLNPCLLYLDDYELPLPPNMHIKDIVTKPLTIFRICPFIYESIRDVYQKCNSDNIIDFFKNIKNIYTNLFTIRFRLIIVKNNIEYEIYLLWNRYTTTEFHWTLIHIYAKSEDDVIEYIKDDFFDSITIKDFSFPPCTALSHVDLTFDKNRWVVKSLKSNNLITPLNIHKICDLCQSNKFCNNCELRSRTF